MRLSHFAVWLFPMVLAAGIVSGQTYPTKPVRILTSAPGGTSDFTSRIVAQGLTASLGQPVIVDNRAGGVAIAEPVSKATPDGYTLLIDGATMWVPPLMQKMPYDPVSDFAPISLIVSLPNVLVVHPSLPVKSVKELISLAKAKPGALSYGSTPPGGSVHLSTELFNIMAGIKTVRISYKGAGPAVVALIGGEVQLMFSSAISVLPHMKSGRLRALGVASLKPSALLPGVPPVAASLPGYEAVAFFGIFAPAKTPDALIKRLNQEIVQIVNRPDVKEKFSNAGGEAVGSSPEELAAAVRTDMAKWGKVIKDGNIRAE